VADALLKPKLPLDDATITKRNARKRTHSATSPEVDNDDSGALQTGPRVRQRRDSNSISSAAPPDFDEQLRGEGKAKLPTGASSALKKLKEKLTPTQPAEVSDASRDSRPSLSTKPSSPLVHISKTENITTQTVAFPSKRATGTAPTQSKTVVVCDPLIPSKAHPLQSLSTNTESTRTQIRVPIPGARLTKYGCYELKASEFELAVTFPSSSRSNFEVWDQEDE
jgi:hypothetical protein